MQFSNPIIGQEELIRPAIRSNNYVPGQSGWRIAANGSAEFTNIKVQSSDGAGNSIELNDGEIIISDSSNTELAAVKFNDSKTTAGFWTRDFDSPRNTYAFLNGGQLDFGTLSNEESSQAYLHYSTSGASLTTAELDIVGPRINFGGNQPSVTLVSNSDNSSDINVSASAVSVTGIFTAKNEAWGRVTVNPIANTPTSAVIMGLNISGTTFQGHATVHTAGIGTIVRGVSIQNPSATGMIVWVYRTTTDPTPVSYSIKGY